MCCQARRHLVSCPSEDQGPWCLVLPLSTSSLVQEARQGQMGSREICCPSQHEISTLKTWKASEGHFII